MQTRREMLKAGFALVIPGSVSGLPLDEVEQEETLPRMVQGLCHKHEHPTLMPEAARRFMRGARYRLVDKQSDTTWLGQTATIQIFFGGRWLYVDRTDLKDNIATGGWFKGASTLQEMIDHYIDRIAYGVRVQDDLFSVIDAISDG